jgi:hypothetical protein
MQYTAENISYTAKKLSFGGILPPNQWKKKGEISV